MSLPLLRLVSLLSFGLLALSGCSNYRLGTEQELPFRTVYVAPVVNKTRLPQAQAQLSTDLRQALARDARVSLANDFASAEATLTVTIVDYRRASTVAREDDTGLSRKFDLTLAVLCTLKDTRTGRVYFEERPIEAVRQIYTDDGQLSAEHQTYALLSENLAAKVARATLEIW